MVRILRDAARMKTAREILIQDGRRFHLFADSAEGRRSVMDRKVAAKRAADAQRRLDQR